MAKHSIPSLKAAMIAVCLMPAGIALAGAPPSGPSAEEAVVLTGWLHVEDHTMADVTLEVVVNGTMHTAHVSENGRFTVSLPADAEATLRFEKPGHLSKEVLVDTRHSQDGPFNQRTRRLKFAVVMQLERYMAGWAYTGPVGSIGFETGGGCLAVAHDRGLVPATRNAPMVF
jgi:hypothetical protein